MANKSIKSIFLFLSIISANEKRKLAFLSVFFSISSAVEIIAIVLIIPLFSSFTDTSTNIFPALEMFFVKVDNFFGIDDIIITKVLAVFLVIFTKNIFQIWVQLQVSKFGYKIEDSITKRVLNFSFNMVLSTQNEQTSSTLIKNCTNDSHRLNLFFVNPLLVIVSDIILLSSIVIFLLIFNPLITFLAGLIIGIIVISFHLFAGKYIYVWGENLTEKEGEKIDIIQQIFYNLTQIQLGSKVKFFMKKFNDINSVFIKNSYYQHSLQNITKNIYEIILFLGLILLLVIPTDGSKIILIGTFALAVYKLLPSLNRITSNYQSIQFSIPSLENLSRVIMFDAEKDKIEKIDFQNLEFKLVSFKYQNPETQVINKISFKIEKGDFIGITGESGSGKSTLLSLIMGLDKPSSGKIVVNNKQDSPKKIKYGYVPQKIHLINESIKRNIAFGIKESEISIDRLNSAIRFSELEDLISNLEDGVETIVGDSGSKLSGGQVQRIGIARALYDNPDILVFDESTNSLDKKTETKIIKTITNLSNELTIIFVTHNHLNIKGSNKILEI